MTPDLGAVLTGGELELTARIGNASNVTFKARVGGTDVAYKPIAGERPLWDFPDAVLAHREVAAWVLSDFLGWDLVPPTVLREGPRGPGMVQLWCEPDPVQEPVTIVEAGATPPGFRHVFDGLGYDDRPVSLVHEDSGVLRRMALFDVLANNADRKGGHVLAMPGGHRYAIDHGICFHTEPKLRTVLWGWAGEPLSDDELDGVRVLRAGLDGDLREELERWLAVGEVDALARRADRLLRVAALPVPGSGWPSIPWPPF
ncbi:MAG: SCO1664 family protein [Nocardioides sp.]|uniref:SCO1664 family protein n=1 Tax=Nocardioides sp. TaxID=35761 RepID=UPI0039E5CCAA